MIVPVIMSGGAGTRLWPLAREQRPKPLLPLVDGNSTFVSTLARVCDDQGIFDRSLVVANVAHQHMLRAAIGEAGSRARLLLEPEPRDTAAAIAAATRLLASENPEAVLLFLAADHLVRDIEGFHRTVLAALPSAVGGAIVTFGIRPTQPSESYGYIATEGPVTEAGRVVPVTAFIEKPDAETARRYLADGYLWNSGNFMMSVATALAEFAAYAPDIDATAAEAVAAADRRDDDIIVLPEGFRSARRISFDHAVMEHTDRAVVVAADFDWSDLGTWASVWEAGDKDIWGNVVAGSATLVAASGNYVSTDRPTIGIVGIDDLVVVASDDTVLIAPRLKSDAVKSLVAEIRRQPEAKIGDRARHYRPWGYYQSIDLGAAHQVKRIVVSPGQRLSLQKHRHRSEHWTVVEGVAELTVDDRILTLGPNESVYIPLGAVHRAANPGSTPTTLIEVQCGDYLGEDDIVRFEDDYGRIASVSPEAA
jgi:mannose-1-phosphate guanylyltransferase / mannose-6-phosphate isomerase